MDTQEVPPEDLVLLFLGLGGVIEDGGPFVLLLVGQPPVAQSFRLLELFVGELFVGLGLLARHLERGRGSQVWRGRRLAAAAAAAAAEDLFMDRGVHSHGRTGDGPKQSCARRWIHGGRERVSCAPTRSRGRGERWVVKAAEGGEGRGERSYTFQSASGAKLLGVIFDTEMRWKTHVQHATKKATTTALGMSGLRHLRPAQMRQIYQACVLPKLDYASTVWLNPLRDKGLMRFLASVQRAALLRIISAFRTVATQTLEVECHVSPTRLRLKQRAQDVIARLCTLPQYHPMAKVIERTKQRVKRKSGLKFPLAESMKTMNVAELNDLETIDPRPRAPWCGSPLAQVEIIQDRDQALARVEDLGHDPGKIIFTDASAKDAQLGAGIVMLGSSPEQRRPLQIGIGSATRWNVHLAELMAIWYATKMIQDFETQTQLQEDIEAMVPTANEATAYTIVSDSQSALKAIITSAAKSGQTIVQRILDQVQSLKKWHIRVRLCWVPAHANVEGNEAADQLAKQAVSTTEDHDFRTPLSTYRRALHQTIEKEWRDEWTTSKNGKYLKKIDGGLPHKRALRLYGPLTRHETYLFTQLRSDHSWLSTYGKKRKFVDHDKCACGAVETVVHVLVDCPLLREARQELRLKVGDAFGSIATLLGGRNGQGQVNKGSSDRNVVKAVLEFADASQRFTSRTSAVQSSGHSRP